MRGSSQRRLAHVSDLFIHCFFTVMTFIRHQQGSSKSELRKNTRCTKCGIGLLIALDLLQDKSQCNPPKTLRPKGQVLRNGKFPSHPSSFKTFFWLDTIIA